ncbi:MAG: DNA polymerase III subunit delta [Proteobacteria bacterium]|nr:DNA polymerase III subunit delta [Pseudomonadota bacterium]
MITAAVQKALDEGVPAVVVVVGEAGLLVERAEQALVAATLPKCGIAAFNHSVVRAGDSRAMDALATAQTVPMMADVRLVVLRDLQEGSDALFEALVEYAKSPVDSAVVVCTGTGFPKVRKGGSNWGVRLKNALKSTGLFVKISASEVSPPALATQHAKSLGKELPRRAASLLVELVGPDLGRLVQEVEKLVLFAGDEPVLSEEIVLAASSMVAEGQVWDLTAGLVARNPDVALAALHRALEQGEPEHKLLGLIGWQLRQVLEATDLLARGVPEREVQKRTRMRWDAFNRVKTLAEGGAPSAADVLHRLAVANRLMNSHRAGTRRVLEEFVVSVATRA